MRKDQRGRPPKQERREKVRALRKAGYSYTEIAEVLGLKSKQLARHYDKFQPKGLTIDKEKVK